MDLKFLFIDVCSRGRVPDAWSGAEPSVGWPKWGKCGETERSRALRAPGSAVERASYLLLRDNVIPKE